MGICGRNQTCGGEGGREVCEALGRCFPPPHPRSKHTACSSWAGPWPWLARALGLLIPGTRWDLPPRVLSPGGGGCPAGPAREKNSFQWSSLTGLEKKEMSRAGRCRGMLTCPSHETTSETALQLGSPPGSGHGGLPSFSRSVCLLRKPSP